jgi:sulfite exporter TauE/SafE
MKKNVGGIDSIIRTVLGAAIAAVGFFASMSTALRVVAFVVAVVLLFTGIYGFCPIWSALGINTYKEKKA